MIPGWAGLVLFLAGAVVGMIIVVLQMDEGSDDE